ncbi:MAG: DUF5989 family protein [Acidobacteriota bacterium]
MAGNDRSNSSPEAFSAQAEQKSAGLVRELWDLIRHNKKWWLLPPIVLLLFVGLLAVLGGTAAAPLIYTLF